jgi:peptide-methionine (S)-S-oxide reductase
MDKKLVIFVFIILTGNSMSQQRESATLGGGCFWCTEAIYQQLTGVQKVTPGYSGGHIRNPSYEEVCTGNTGHAEVVQLEFDPSRITFTEILEVFFKTHDPTTLNRQGSDVGTQYRSAIFYHSVEQKQTAEAIIRLLAQESVYPDPIVTEITPFENFYPAEDYHKEYFAHHKNQPYCRMIILPKLEKFEKTFSEKLKK